MDLIDISPGKDGGVLKQIIREGEGDVCAPLGSTVKVHYTGTLLDGTKFDSSRDRGEPFEFSLGKGSVIKAWDIGVATMKKNEQAILTCAADYAYGQTGSPPTIPPDSTLKFDVEVIDWQAEDLSPKKDGGIERLQINAGSGHTSPNDGAVVEVHIVGKYEDKVFDERDVSFTVGEGSEAQIVSGIETAIVKFTKGETSKLVLKPQYAYGKEGSAEFNIPPNATVEYTVTLKQFEEAAECWSLDKEEKIQQCKIFKDKGTNYFKTGKLGLAFKLYKKILTFLENEKDLEEDQTKEVQSLLLAANLNLALCCLKHNEAFDAKNYATTALQIDSKNEKALFRRGQAFIVLGEPQLASEDFAECLKIDPNNKAAVQQHAICKKHIKEQLVKEKRIYANMFDKFAKMDTQREEFEKKKEPNVMSSVGEWGKEDREREPSEFEKENPNILMLNGSGEFKDM